MSGADLRQAFAAELMKSELCDSGFYNGAPVLLHLTYEKGRDEINQTDYLIEKTLVKVAQSDVENPQIGDVILIGSDSYGVISEPRTFGKLPIWLLEVVKT